MHAELCPVCNGTGLYYRENWDKCHGCDGDGWVEVNDGNDDCYQAPFNPCYISYPDYQVDQPFQY